MEADGGAAKNSMEAVEEQETTNNTKEQEAAGGAAKNSMEADGSWGKESFWRKSSQARCCPCANPGN